MFTPGKSSQKTSPREGLPGISQPTLPSPLGCHLPLVLVGREGDSRLSVDPIPPFPPRRELPSPGGWERKGGKEGEKRREGGREGGKEKEEGGDRRRKGGRKDRGREGGKKRRRNGGKEGENEGQREGEGSSSLTSHTGNT